ncbi:MAG: class I SAM-dependent methyltransferase [bacterium]|nr:class I SAM-dependent methyltransferase [bacterium]
MMQERSPQEAEAVEHNRLAWDRMAESGHVLARPALDRELADPLTTVDAAKWLPSSIEGWQVLCLAAGGGRHGPLYASAGARVTVLDISSGMLELDRRVAEERRLNIRTVQSSMDNLGMFADEEFDLVIHPVSTCYLPSLANLFSQVARVVRPGGLYISQHKQPANLQASLETHTGQYVVEHAYYDPAPVPPARTPNKLREPNTREFAHSWETILGGICRHGFVIEDVIEPNHAKRDAPLGSFHHRCFFVAPYVRIKARRSGPRQSSKLFLGSGS